MKKIIAVAFSAMVLMACTKQREELKQEEANTLEPIGCGGGFELVNETLSSYRISINDTIVIPELQPRAPMIHFISQSGRYKIVAREIAGRNQPYKEVIINTDINCGQTMEVIIR
ncbi:MAG TPA: hypothetical protein VEB42_08405 [Chitinophagaceae bacterium]|nr:hypothetical protein [Chitinophagaceae bacterium]